MYLNILLISLKHTDPVKASSRQVWGSKIRRCKKPRPYLPREYSNYGLFKPLEH